MKVRVNHFTDELKFKIVQEYLSTEISRDDLMQKYQFRGCGNIQNWMRKFGLTEPDREQIVMHRAMAKETGVTAKEKELEARIKQLEKELEYEKLRVHALDTMINIAERELKIPIRKKSGARQ